MRFVPIKSVQQQSDLSLHRVRQGFVEERTATFNRIRGLIAEFGYVLPNGVEQLRRQVPDLLERLPAQVRIPRMPAGDSSRCRSSVPCHAGPGVSRTLILSLSS
jgi:transposase